MLFVRYVLPTLFHSPVNSALTGMFVRLVKLSDVQAGSDPITAVRVVVAHAARRGHKPHTASVATRGRAQPTVARRCFCPDVILD